MGRLALSLFALSLVLVGARPAAAQSDPVLVLIVDPGPTRVNQEALQAAIGRSVERTVIRMTDERAPTARGRLTIAFSRPNRWVLRYEAGGQVAWVSDRITRPGQLRARLAELSANVVGIVEGPRPRQRRPSDWNEDIIIALQDEIVDPFADEPRPARSPVTVLWSEVVDPFAADGPPRRARTDEVWSEVLDPWAGEVRRRRH